MDGAESPYNRVIQSSGAVFYYCNIFPFFIYSIIKVVDFAWFFHQNYKILWMEGKKVDRELNWAPAHGKIFKIKERILVLQPNQFCPWGRPLCQFGP